MERKTMPSRLFPDGNTLTILCKFRETQIVPNEAIDRMWLCTARTCPQDWLEWKETPLLTTDGKLAQITLLWTINNQDNSYDNFLDSLVKNFYGEDMTFEFLKSNWKARMKISNCWHGIMMTEVDSAI